MKRRRESSDGKAAIMLALLVVVAAVALVAGGGKSHDSKATGASPPASASSSTASAAVSDPAQVARTQSVVKALMTTWNTAWSAKRNRDALSSFFADDVMYYDATIAGVITKGDMDAMGQDPSWWKSFRLKLESFFVSPDGRFAATLGRIALRSDKGNLPWQPAASLMAITDGQIEWEYDYYGGDQGKATQTEPLPNISRSAGATAQSLIAEATATVEKWLTAYNNRDAGAFLSSYAENAKYIDVVSPRWRIMTKSQLAADVASRFSRTDFASRLEPSLGSAMKLPFFVSADGRNAAVQASTGAGGVVPMLVVLELKAGQIVRQYNYSASDRSLLTP